MLQAHSEINKRFHLIGQDDRGRCCTAAALSGCRVTSLLSEDVPAHNRYFPSDYKDTKCLWSKLCYFSSMSTCAVLIFDILSLPITFIFQEFHFFFKFVLERLIYHQCNKNIATASITCWISCSVLMTRM